MKNKAGKDYIGNIKDGERRFLTGEVSFETRNEDDVEVGEVFGYAALYNSRSDFGWMQEEILPGFFDDVLKDDVRCLYNHDPSLVLARSKDGQGTLTLSLDEKGLKYSYITPNISYAKDLLESIRLGNVSQSSFGFVAEETVWIETDGGPDIRQLKKCKQLFDVSPVTFPAYTDTTVAKRSFDSIEQAPEDIATESPATPTERKFDEFEARHKFNLNNTKK